MGVSKKFKEKLNLLQNDFDRMIRMGWEDRSTFDDIQIQFGLTPNEFVRFMRSQLNRSHFERWRRRVFEQGQLKNEKIRGFKTSRFKCTRQTVDGLSKGWK